MKIAVDCRYIGKSGIGRVCEGILNNLDYDKDEYYLIGKYENLKKYGKAKIINDDTEPYSVRGLFSFEKECNHVCDALLIPNFLIPFGVRIPVYTVMHDLAFLDVKETTRGILDRTIKKTLLKRCMKKSEKVFCVSEFTRSRCRYYYKKKADKCIVNYNGISDNVFEYARSHQRRAKDNTIVFVGNVKPHKGLKTLLAAFNGAQSGAVLKIIGEKDTFLTGLSLDEASYRNVVFTGKMKDEELFEQIQAARFLVLPSKYEGFGLPPLEALCLGTQAIVSDIEVFREIYQGLPVIYFSDVNDLMRKLLQAPSSINCLNEIEARYNYKNCTDTIIKNLKNSNKKGHHDGR